MWEAARDANAEFNTLVAVDQELRRDLDETGSIIEGFKADVEDTAEARDAAEAANAAAQAAKLAAELSGAPRKALYGGE